MTTPKAETTPKTRKSRNKNSEEQAKDSDLESYHYVWLSAHPERTEEWLRGILAQGFHVHHIDGCHSNDDPKNLVLIEAGDHMMIHNGKSRLIWRPQAARKPKGVKPGRKKALEKIAKLEELLEKSRRNEVASAARLQEVGNSKCEINIHVADVTHDNSENRMDVTYQVSSITLPHRPSKIISPGQRNEIAEFHRLMKNNQGVRRGL